MSEAQIYLDQNYLSGIAKRKPAFRELEPVLRDAVARGAVAVLESPVHEAESRPRPDLRLLELLRELSGGRRLPAAPDRAAREARRRLAWTIEHEFPQRLGRASDAADLEALAGALVHCDLVTCDAFMADVARRARLDLRHECELFTGRRADVLRLRDRVARLTAAARTRGSLFGLATGDALGAPLEGSPPEHASGAVAAGLEMTGGGIWAPGEWTDDTALALCLAESIAARGLLDTEDLAARYIEWARTGKGIGHTTRAALGGAVDAADLRARAEAYHAATGRSATNGSVMRAAPIGLVATSAERAAACAREDAGLTHHDPVAGDASAALCAALVALREGDEPLAAAETQVRRASRLHEVLSAVRARDTGALAALAAGAERGACWTTLGVALLALDLEDYEHGVCWAVSLGGDTDTNAAVAGALIGCRDGPGAIPERWLAALRDRERLDRTADALATASVDSR